MPADHELVERLKEALGDAICGANLEAIDPWIEIRPESILEVAKYLRDQLHYDMLNCISGVDYFLADPKKLAKAPWKPHIEVVYHLSGTVTKQRLVLKTMLPRWQDDEEGRLPEVPSLTSIWRTADWHEREVYDLMGVRFVGHTDLRRILCPEDWVGHPLRKDYQQPDFYHGIRNQ